MKIICGIVLGLFGVLTAGDVSHLSSNYLPPKKLESYQQQQQQQLAAKATGATGLSVIVTSEQQTLRELAVEEFVTNAKTAITLTEELQAPPPAAQLSMASVTMGLDLPQPQLLQPQLTIAAQTAMAQSNYQQYQDQLTPIQTEADAKLAKLGTAINMGVGVEQQRQQSASVQ